MPQAADIKRDEDAALAESEDKYRRIVETATEGIWLTGADGKVFFCNSRLADMLGRTQEEILGRHALAFLYPEDRAAAAARLEQRIATRSAQRYEARLRRRDASELWVLFSVTPLFDETGAYSGSLAMVTDITDRKRAEETGEQLLAQLQVAGSAIRRERDLQQIIMDNTRTCLVLLDRDFNFLRMNKAYEETCGRSEAEFIGHNHFEFYPHAENQAIFERVRDTGEAVEFRAKPFDFPDDPERGTTYWDWTLTPVKNALGQVEGVVFSLMDVTERIRWEKALADSEERFRLLAERSGDVVFRYVLHPEPKLEYISPACALLTGYTPEELYAHIPGSVSPMMHPDDRNIVTRAVAAQSPDALTGPHRLRWMCKDGSTIWVELMITPVRDEAGNVVAIEGSARDVTERKRAEDALRESEERFRLLAERSPDAVFRSQLRPKHKLEYVSRGLCALTGYSAEELYANADNDAPRERLVHPEDWALSKAIADEPASFTKPVRLRWIGKDGTVIWVEQVIRPFYDEMGNVVAIQGAARDITERKQAEERLERLQNEFLGMVSHELRMPITVIKGAAAIGLEKRMPLDAYETQELFETVSEQSGRLAGLVNNLLDASRIEAGNFSVTPAPTDLRDALAEANALFLRTGGRNQVISRLPEDLPQVQADLVRIVQVLSNLLTNAGKFSTASTPITISADYDSLQVTVHVSDRGRGIPKEKMGELFKRFSHVHEESPLDRGTGLGLAVCKGIVESHGGRIWASSEGEGQGSTFSFTLPIVPGSGATALAAPPPPRRASRRDDTRRILALDDDPHILRYLQRCLTDAGYTPITTAEPQDVPRLVEEEQPDLLLLDLILPQTSGLQVLQRIREFSDVPVIFLTASTQNEDMVRALKMGADDYITKPFAPSELLARIEVALRRQQLGQAASLRPDFVLKDLVINFAERRVTVDGEDVSLTATEYKLLRELASNAGRVLTHDQILRQVWGPEYSGETDLVRSFIRNLRRKLREDAHNPRFVLTERQVGYYVPNA